MLGNLGRLLILFVFVAADRPFILTAADQANPAIEFEGAAAKEKVDGDLESAAATYRKIANDTTASRELRAKALLRLAHCYEKLGRQAQQVYRQLVTEYADFPEAKQAKVHLSPDVPVVPSAMSARQWTVRRLTQNTPELPVQSVVGSPDGKRVAYSDPLGIHILDGAGGEARLLPETQGMRAVEWTHDSKAVRTYKVEGVRETMSLIDATGNPLSKPEVSNLVLSSPNGAYRAVLSLDRTRIYIGRQEQSSAQGEGSLREIWRAPQQSRLLDVEWSPDCLTIAVISRRMGDRSGNSLELIRSATKWKSSVISLALGPYERTERRWIDGVAFLLPHRIVVSVLEKQEALSGYSSNLFELRPNRTSSQSPLRLVRLTSWTDFPIRPGSLKSDGKRLICIRSFQQRGVYLAALSKDGSQISTPRRLTLDLADVYPNDWTRDSKTVLFTSTSNGRQSIFEQDTDRPTATQISKMPGWQVWGRVTPDGQSILFSDCKSSTLDDCELMRMPLKGGEAQPVPHTEGVGSGYGCSLAGRCAMSQPDGHGKYVISELDPQSGKGREIYRTGLTRAVAVSPNGHWLGEAGTIENKTKLVLRSFETGTVEREIPLRWVTTLCSFAFASDGKGFFVGDCSPSVVRELHFDWDGNPAVLWSQPVGEFARPIWGIPSPDGKNLALVLTTDDANAYAIENL